MTKFKCGTCHFFFFFFLTCHFRFCTEEEDIWIVLVIRNKAGMVWVSCLAGKSLFIVNCKTMHWRKISYSFKKSFYICSNGAELKTLSGAEELPVTTTFQSIPQIFHHSWYTILFLFAPSCPLYRLAILHLPCSVYIFSSLYLRFCLTKCKYSLFF